MSDTEAEDCLAVWCSGDAWCPITCTAKVIARKWHPVIVHRLLANGALGFNDLAEEVDGVSSSVLSDSLDDLEEKGIVDRSIVNEKPVRVEYELTPRGESLEPIIDAMTTWGREQLTDPN